MESFLGIDGGGSTTRALLVDANGKKLHYTESGPSNVNVCGEAEAINSLLEVVESCVQASDTRAVSACFGIAGAGNPDIRKKLESAVLPLGLGKIHITSDAVIALEGAFSGGPGILLIAGTGSVCLGKSDDGSIHQCGGWGWLADDAGSAGWIGQRALEAAVQQNDGRIEGHGLRDFVFKVLDINDSSEICSKIHQPLLSRTKIAKLAETVFELAGKGDAAAEQIKQSALSELENMVRSLARKMNTSSARVAMTGGLLMNHPTFQKELKSRLSDYTVQNPETTPLEGAVALARHNSTRF